MKLSAGQVTCGIIAALVFLLFVCAAGTSIVLWFELGPGAGTATVDRIAYVGPDGNIYTLDASGENRRALTDDAIPPSAAGGRLYRFPTWSPDSQHVAFVGVEASTSIPQTSTLYTIPAEGGEPDVLFSSTEVTPFYLYWAPNSRRVAFLASKDQSLSLHLADLDNGAQMLDTGAPFYFSWAPDSQTLITHVGAVPPQAHIGRLRAENGQPEIIEDNPAFFLAPAWSPDGKAVLFAARMDGGQPALYLADTSGMPQQTLVRFNGAISFVWSPQGDRIAYIVTDRPRPSGLGQFAYGPVQVINRDGSNPRQLSGRNALAFFWSPDGQWLAYLVPNFGQDGSQGRLSPIRTAVQASEFRLRWHVVDVTTGADQLLVSFRPAPGFLSLIPFFDQYAQSLTLWSPDSSKIVYSARESDDTSAIWVVAVDGQTPARRIAAGDLPVWSWK